MKWGASRQVKPAGGPFLINAQEDAHEDTHVQRYLIDCLQMRGFKIEILNGQIAVTTHTY